MELQNITNEQRQELTLLLLYLNSWIEEGIPRAWKNHDFGTLDALIEQDFIAGSHKSKSIYFSQSGKQKAEELMEKYFKG
jgi:hypothetical protein